MTSIEGAGWQERRPSQRAVTVKNGLESVYDGTVESLIKSAKALTLMTRAGGEVNIALRGELGPDSWEGEVLRAAPATDSPPLGSIVKFRSQNVFGATL